MYMSLYTFLQSWEPTNRTSLSGGGVYTVSVLVASCGPRDALTYGPRAFPVSMTKVSKKISTFVPSGQDPQAVPSGHSAAWQSCVYPPGSRFPGRAVTGFFCLQRS